MNNLSYFSSLAILLTLTSCSSNDSQEIYTHERKNEINVYDKVVGIKIDPNSMVISGVPYVVGKYIVMQDSNNPTHYLHVFDKSDFHHIKAILPKGHGPGELANLSSFVTPIKNTNELYLLANNHKFMRINVDSAIAKVIYKPEILHNFGKKAKLYGTNYCFINDSIAITDLMEPTGNKGYNDYIGKFNIKTGEFQKFDYAHPKGSRKRIYVAASADNNVCAELYDTRDLITLYDLEGNFKCNIYGPDWTGDDKTHGKVYFHEGYYIKDKLLAAYSGMKWGNDDYPRKIFVYDLSGNYIKTLDFGGHQINSFEYDEDNYRLILKTDEYELAYLPLDGIL